MTRRSNSRKQVQALPGASGLAPVATPRDTYYRPAAPSVGGPPIGTNQITQIARSLQQFRPSLSQFIEGERQEMIAGEKKRAADLYDQYESIGDFKAAVDAGEIERGDNPWLQVFTKQLYAKDAANQFKVAASTLVDSQKILNADDPAAALDEALESTRDETLKRYGGSDDPYFRQVFTLMGQDIEGQVFSQFSGRLRSHRVEQAHAAVQEDIETQLTSPETLAVLRTGTDEEVQNLMDGIVQAGDAQVGMGLVSGRERKAIFESALMARTQALAESESSADKEAALDLLDAASKARVGPAHNGDKRPRISDDPRWQLSANRLRSKISQDLEETELDEIREIEQRRKLQFLRAQQAQANLLDEFSEKGIPTSSRQFREAQEEILDPLLPSQRQQLRSIVRGLETETDVDTQRAYEDTINKTWNDFALDRISREEVVTRLTPILDSGGMDAKQRSAFIGFLKQPNQTALPTAAAISYRSAERMLERRLRSLDALSQANMMDPTAPRQLTREGEKKLHTILSDVYATVADTEGIEQMSAREQQEVVQRAIETHSQEVKDLEQGQEAAQSAQAQAAQATASEGSDPSSVENPVTPLAKRVNKAAYSHAKKPETVTDELGDEAAKKLTIEEFRSPPSRWKSGGLLGVLNSPRGERTVADIPDEVATMVYQMKTDQIGFPRKQAIDLIRGRINEGKMESTFLIRDNFQKSYRAWEEWSYQHKGDYLDTIENTTGHPNASPTTRVALAVESLQRLYEHDGVSIDELLQNMNKNNHGGVLGLAFDYRTVPIKDDIVQLTNNYITAEEPGKTKLGRLFRSMGIGDEDNEEQRKRFLKVQGQLHRQWKEFYESDRR